MPTTFPGVPHPGGEQGQHPQHRPIGEAEGQRPSSGTERGGSAAANAAKPEQAAMMMITPIPEPATIILVGVAIVVLSIWIGRRSRK